MFFYCGSIVHTRLSVISGGMGCSGTNSWNVRIKARTDSRQGYKPKMLAEYSTPRNAIGIMKDIDRPGSAVVCVDREAIKNGGGY